MKLPKNRKKIILYSLLGLGILFLAFVLFAVITVASLVQNLPSAEQIDNRQVSQSTKIYDRTGETLLYEIHGEERRTVIPFDQIPENVKRATTAIEDQNFYNHPAVDWRGILRAFIKNILNLKIEQGGSTITQQLAKKAFLSDERTITRKLKELILAFVLEKRYSKDQILSLYLNQIPYGSNAYGIESAARTYFNKSAKDLDLAESALLASLPKGPTYYSPYGSHIEELLSRKDVTLEQMKRLGYISDKETKQAKMEKLKFEPQSTGSIKAPHFVMAVQDYLDKKYGNDALESGGLKVITTLDWKLQQEAEDAVSTGAKRNTELYKGKNAALFAEDPKTGQILAMVGSANYFDVNNEGNFNVATQGLRQPGSSFKPFAYMTAFEKGYTPDTVLFDVPTEFDATGIPGNSYKPGNFDGLFLGPMRVRNALAQSRNIPAVKTMYLAGIDNVLKTARDLGITTLTERSRYGLSLVLGGGEVKLSEMVGAYSAFATEGVKHDQTMVLEVDDSKGQVLEKYADNSSQVVDPQYPRLINDILSDVNARSPLYSNSLPLTIFGDRDVALKTGTSNDYIDAWSIGYTPSLVVGVWAGNNHREPLQKKGGSVLAAVPIWSEFMHKALEGTPAEVFNKPDSYATAKPILNGDYTGGKQVHSILYYVDKNDPRGPYPSHPESDPQFYNWENPVLEWARANVSDFSSYNQGPLPPLQASQSSSSGNISINILSPDKGSFVQNQFNVYFEVNSNEELSSAEVYFNNSLLDKVFISGNSYTFQKIENVGNLDTQNLLQIKITAKSGRTGEEGVIVYK